jgi:ribosomal protein S18 acetylase RimI-like enzyme
MTIRPLRHDDRPAIARILRQTKVFTETEVLCALELIDVYLNVAGQKDYILECAVDEADRPLGYVCYGPTPLTEGTYDLYWIAVDPDCHGQGVGTLLMEHVEQRLRPLGRLVLIETSSQPKNHAARRFYLRHHYQEVARVPDFYAEGDDRVIYAKRLR